MNYKIKGLEVEITDEQLDELIKERENKGKPWKPEYYEEYWLINDQGTVLGSRWYGAQTSNYRWESGNCFKTEEEAEAKLNYLKAINTVNAKIRELNDGWTPDWSNNNQEKWFIYYNYRVLSWKGACYHYENEFPILSCIKSKELVEQVIEECAEELETIKQYKFNK